MTVDKVYTRDMVYEVIDGVKAGWSAMEDGLAEILEHQLWTVLDYRDFAALYAGEGLDKFKLSAAVRTAAIKQLAADRPKDSNREIAKKVGVSPGTVDRTLKTPSKRSTVIFPSASNEAPNNKIIDVPPEETPKTSTPNDTTRNPGSDLDIQPSMEDTSTVPPPGNKLPPEERTNVKNSDRDKKIQARRVTVAALRNDGWTQAQIAEKLQVGETTIHRDLQCVDQAPKAPPLEPKPVIVPHSVRAIETSMQRVDMFNTHFIRNRDFCSLAEAIDMVLAEDDHAILDTVREKLKTMNGITLALLELLGDKPARSAARAAWTPETGVAWVQRARILADRPKPGPPPPRRRTQNRDGQKIER
jgi:transposase